MTNTRGLEPTRDPRTTLPDLLEVLLNKGVYLDLDLIISVADIPLIGVNLRATIAGIETMLEHGMMRAWDEQTRAWVRRSLSRNVPLAEGEDLVTRMAGGHRQEEPYVTWRPGIVYLTTHRLLVWRADPREVLWQANLADVTDVNLRTERSVGGEDRRRVAVTTSAGTSVLSAAAPDRLADMVRQTAGVGEHTVPPSSPGTAPALEGRVWYQEVLAGGATWRGGTCTVSRTAGLTWRGTLDTRPAVRLRPEDIVSVDVVRGRSPTGRSVVRVLGPGGTVRLATDDDARWVRELRALSGAPSAQREGGAA
ncbi:gas vesicle protein [Georgenia alba]|uniref:Gas vesicle protein n=1 Tax=Georgenia alba TaxID=2233858 RepID=A0ABW2Q468_9MICO